MLRICIPVLHVGYNLDKFIIAPTSHQVVKAMSDGNHWTSLTSRRKYRDDSLVDNIFFAKPTDYKKATIKIFRSASQPSYVELPLGQP